MSDSVKKYFENATSTIPITKEDKIVQDVQKKYTERSRKGIETYGTTLEDSSEDMRAFLVK
jgi:diphthamide biosynthesis methyltransferase